MLQHKQQQIYGRIKTKRKFYVLCVNCGFSVDWRGPKVLHPTNRSTYFLRLMQKNGNQDKSLGHVYDALRALTLEMETFPRRSACSGWHRWGNITFYLFYSTNHSHRIDSTRDFYTGQSIFFFIESEMRSLKNKSLPASTYVFFRFENTFSCMLHHVDDWMYFFEHSLKLVSYGRKLYGHAHALTKIISFRIAFSVFSEQSTENWKKKQKKMWENIVLNQN